MNKKRIDYIYLISSTILIFLYVMIPIFTWLTNIKITHITEIAIVLIAVYLVFSVAVDIRKKDLEQSIVEKVTLPLYAAFLGLAFYSLAAWQDILLVGDGYYKFSIMWLPSLFVFVYALVIPIKKDVKWTLILKYGCFILIVLINILLYPLIIRL